MYNSNQNAHFCSRIFSIAVLLTILACINLSCKNFFSKKGEAFKKSVNTSWNILFEPGVMQSDKEAFLDQLKASITKFYNDYRDSTNFSVQLTVHPKIVCPCDSLLYTLDITCNISGVGESATSPKPGKGGPRGSGDHVGIAKVSDNIPIEETLTMKFPDSNELKALGNTMQGFFNVKQKADFKIDNDKIFAIIDSGIDTALFEKGYHRLIWKEQIGIPTIYNFLPGQLISDFKDETPQRHGSAVTAVALAAMRPRSPVKQIYPRIMILKALDKNNRGSIFSVSCALSYASQKNATIINASLGYYGEADSILSYYVSGTTRDHHTTELFASAGNTRGTHDVAKLCASPADSILKYPRLFFPACFRYKNVTSVTQFNEPGKGCFYQNFSPEYVKLGVINKNQCCYLGVDFKTGGTQYYEGSSFAMPVAAGTKMRTVIETNVAGPSNVNWDNLVITNNAARNNSVNGQYIMYPNR